MWMNMLILWVKRVSFFPSFFPFFPFLLLKIVSFYLFSSSSPLSLSSAFFINYFSTIIGVESNVDEYVDIMGEESEEDMPPSAIIQKAPVVNNNNNKKNAPTTI